MTAHPSDSLAQRTAEADMLRILSTQEGVPLAPGRFALSGGSHVEVDGIDPEGTWFIEVYARIGGLKPAQLKKIATDVLKLVLIQELCLQRGIGPRLTLVFASEQALGSVRGWLLEAITSHGIETRVVTPAPEIAERVIAAQRQQFMVNVGTMTDMEST